MSRKKVYLAGPISRGDLQENIDKARAAGKALILAGMAPLIPQLSCFLGGNEPATNPGDIAHHEWLEVDFPWVAASDALLRLPGESVGADQEVALANKLGIPVFHNLAALIEHFIPPETGTERRRNVLADVAKCVCRDRQNTYGDAEDNFADIAEVANVMLRPKLKEDLDALDVAKFSLAIKVGRIKTSPRHRDNWIDAAGYSVCGAGIVDSEAAQAERPNQAERLSASFAPAYGAELPLFDPAESFKQHTVAPPFMQAAPSAIDHEAA